MAIRRGIQSSLTYTSLVLLWLFTAGLCAWEAILVRDPTFRELTVSDSAFMATYWMWFGWLLISLPTRCSPVFRVTLARFVWTLGLVALLSHIVIAFDVAHRWSHAAAVEHVRSVGGFGSGIVVNYLFVAVWLADVVWWWVNPGGHTNRPPWIGWAVHGFLAFVVVNATVVFGPTERRGPYAFGLGLAFLWWLGARALDASDPSSGTHEPGHWPGSDTAPDSTSTHSPT